MKQSRIRPKNPERAAKARAEDFGDQAELCRLMRCTGCGLAPCVPAHNPSRAAGGKDKDTAPLCDRCHRRQHDHGVRTYQREKGVDLLLTAAFLRVVVATARHHHGDRWLTSTLVAEANAALDLLRGGGGPT